MEKRSLDSAQPAFSQSRSMEAPGAGRMPADLLWRSMLVLALLFGMVFAVGTGILWYLRMPLWIGVGFALIVVWGQFLVAPWLIDRVFQINWRDPATVSPAFAAWLGASCEQLKIGMPRWGVIEDGNPNAFTYGRTRRGARVVVTSGLLEMLEPDEVRAVVAHELEHIAHYDFIVMTVAQSVPLVIYIFYVWTRDRARDGAGALAVSVGAYLTYLASQYVVLLLSRVREFFADQGAGQLTRDPSALASALVKISYGLAPRADLAEQQTAMQASTDDHSNDGTAKKKGFLGITWGSDDDDKAAQQTREARLKAAKARTAGNATYATLGICNLDAASGFALSAADGSGQFSPALLQRAAQWDLKNPWAKWFEWQSTHPLTARRIEELAHLARHLEQTPRIELTRDERRYSAPFARELLVAHAPILGGLVGYALGYFALGLSGFASWSPALCGAGLGMLLHAAYAYPRLEMGAQRSIAEVIGDELNASGVNATPVELRGEIIGRGVPGLFWSNDLVLRDESGHLTLQYRQPLGILEFLFGWLKAKKYVGREVRVRGWYRRAPVPYVEISRVEMLDGNAGDGIVCHYLWGHVALGLVLCVAGGLAAWTRTDIFSILWSAVVWVFDIWAHR